MATYGDLIKAALKEIGVLAAGETPTAEEASDAKDQLNRLIDQWAGERLILSSEARTVFTITSGTAVYAVGESQVVNRIRPVFIRRVRFQDTTPTPDLEMDLTRLTEDEYAAIPMKALTSTYPQAWYYNPSFPSGMLTLWPVPTATTLQGVMYAPTAINQVGALTESASNPPGYGRMIVKNLAKELCPSYGREPSQELLEQARESKADVKRENRRDALMSYEAAALIQGGGRWTYDINADR